MTIFKTVLAEDACKTLEIGPRTFNKSPQIYTNLILKKTLVNPPWLS